MFGLLLSNNLQLIELKTHTQNVINIMMKHFKTETEVQIARFPIFLFKRGEILQIQSHGQNQTSSEEPTQLKMVRSLE